MTGMVCFLNALNALNAETSGLCLALIHSISSFEGCVLCVAITTLRNELGAVVSR